MVIGPRETVARPTGTALQTLITAACAKPPSAADPWTIRLLAGIYSSDTQIAVPADCVGLHIIGAGKAATQIRPTAAWYTTVAAGSGWIPFLEMNNCTSCSLQNLTVDGWTNDDLTHGYTGAALPYMVSLAGVDDFLIQNVATRGTGGIFTRTGGGSGQATVQFYDSDIEADCFAVRPGPEQWFGQNSVIRAEHTTTLHFGTGSRLATANGICTASGVPYACCTGNGTGTCGNNGICTGNGTPLGCCTGSGAGTCTNGADGGCGNDAVGIEFGFTSTNYSNMWRGMTIAATDRRLGERVGGSAVATKFTAGASTDWVHFVGSTLLGTGRMTSPDDNAGANNQIAAINVCGACTPAGLISAQGCIFSYESGTTPNGKGNYVGGIVIDSTGVSALKISVPGNTFFDLGGTTAPGIINGKSGMRGDVVYSPTSGTPPTIDLNGCRMKKGILSPVGNIATISPFFINGPTTLQAGIARVLLVAAAGQLCGTDTFAFNSGLSTVTVASGSCDFTAQMLQGIYVRRSGDNDSAWTKVKTVDSATQITLESAYRGTTNAGDTMQVATINATTPTDNLYRVNLTATSQPVQAETYYVTNKHTSGFLITACTGNPCTLTSSTVNLDYQVQK